MASDRSPLTPHRRRHWSVEPAPPPEAPRADVLSPEETRVEAKRLLWRDSAIILVGIVLALLVAQFLPGLAPGLAADQSALAPGAGAGGTHVPGDSAPPDATLGPVVDPSLGIDGAPPPNPPITPPPTLPPTGSFEPVDPDNPTPKPTKRPTATIGPPTPAPTPEPTPEATPEVTPAPTDPPATDPPPTEEPSEQP